MFAHLVARTLGGAPAFADMDQAVWLWQRLREAFPDALAACLMPNHLHLIVPARHDDHPAAHVRLSQVLSGYTRHAARPRLWEPIPPAPIFFDPKHLLRQLRYVLLNPCRGRLVADPLSWALSTHRGVIGAEYAPWVSAERLARVLGRSPGGFAESFHRYVSGDPTVDVSGTPFPIAAPSSEVPVRGLEEILSAARAAVPFERHRQMRRRLAVLLAFEQGFRDTKILAKALGVHPQSIRRHAAQTDDALLRAGALCLGDARLRESPDLCARVRKSMSAVGA